jgi:hypothetical protein
MSSPLPSNIVKQHTDMFSSIEEFVQYAANLDNKTIILANLAVVAVFLVGVGIMGLFNRSNQFVIDGRVSLYRPFKDLLTSILDRPHHRRVPRHGQIPGAHVLRTRRIYRSRCTEPKEARRSFGIRKGMQTISDSHWNADSSTRPVQRIQTSSGSQPYPPT